MAKSRHKTVVRFVIVYMLWRDLNRKPRPEEIMEKLHCSMSCAYNYLNTVEYIFEPILP
jgi:hypothetical protein